MEIQWSLVIFAAFICWGAGTYMATVVYCELMGGSKKVALPSLVLSAAAVIVGALASMTHLGHIDRIFGVLSNPASGIFVEGLSAALLVVVIAVYLVAQARAASEGVLKALAIIGIVPAIVVTFAVGSSYLMVARPAWDVWTLPALSLGTAFAMGSVTTLALATLAKDAASEEPLARMRKLAIVLVVVQALLLVAYVVSVSMAPFQDGSRSVDRLLMGDLALLFWVAVVVCGFAVPFAALFVKTGQFSASGEAAVQKLPILLVVAVVCMVAAAIAFRVIMFSMGSSIIDFGFTL